MSKILKVVGASWLQTKISSYVLGILGVLAILALFVGQIERKDDGNYSATVFYSEKTGYRIQYWGQSNDLDDISRGVARAYFRMDSNTTGWSILEVETDGSYPNEIQAYAAGIVEGALTWYLIHTHLENTIRADCDNKPLEKQCNKIKDALEKSADIWKNYATERSIDPFWHHISLHYTQIRGIYTGWKYGIERAETDYDSDLTDLYWLNSVVEIAELKQKLNVSLDNSTLDYLPDMSSAFLRIVNETSEDGSQTKTLFLAQNAAGRYSSMTRILKRYKFNYHVTANDSNLVSGTSVQFSSYPGSITSQDEFYIVKGEQHRMAVTGTALRNYNSKLWKDVNINEQVPLGPRISAANRLACNVSSWGHILASSNSGTGSKQWLVVDYTRFDKIHEYVPRNDAAKRFRNEIVAETVNEHVKHTVYRSNNSHAKGLAGLVEQVPGLTHSADLSDAFLEQGYWATYGLPFFKDISEITHVTKMQDVYGRIFSELESPKAVLFKRGYKNATSLESIIDLMRQNNVTAMNRASNETRNCDDDIDCVVGENGYWTVLGVRGDIVKQHQQPYGVIDTKVVSGTLHKPSLTFVALSGPPYTKVPQQNITEALNKGNLAPIYTKEFDNKPTINTLEIRDLIKQQQEEAEEETLKFLNRDVVKPFEWSDSPFRNFTREKLPDKWAFVPYQPQWSW